MGLDNGIELKIKSADAGGMKIPSCITSRFESHRTKDGYIFFDQLCYWRKWWPLRNFLIYNWKAAFEDGYEFEVDDDFLNLLYAYVHNALLKPEEWDEIGSIFTWGDMREEMECDLKIVDWIREQLKNPDFKGTFIFYDSY